ncbi:MAG: hypothetical protein LBG84_05355 [Treponema sp.]|jgi:hypothetical protein|nr:hypothetical protein [Treponema sp.]
MAVNKHGYYMPYGDREFLAWARGFKDAIAANQAAWGLTAARVAEIAAAFTVYEEALKVIEDGNPSPADRRAKNDAKEALRRLCQEEVNSEIRYNRAVSDSGRAAAGVHVPDHERTTLTAPDKTVGFRTEPKEAMQLRLDFWVHETGEKAIPYGYDGAVFGMRLLEPGEAVPGDPEELPKGDHFTKTPRVLVFAEADRGKRLALAARWQNRHGKGPWSVIQIAVIP